MKYHDIREAKRNGEVKHIHYSSNFQLLDILTRALPKTISEMLRDIFSSFTKSVKEKCWATTPLLIYSWFTSKYGFSIWL